jgi:hypothetical protein
MNGKQRRGRIMLFLDFDRVPDDALLTKAEVAVWRRTSIDTVEKDVRAGRLVRVQMSARRVGITAGSVRALNRQQASDALRQAAAGMSDGDLVMATSTEASSTA